MDEWDDEGAEGSVCPYCGEALVEDGPEGRWCPACGSTFD